MKIHLRRDKMKLVFIITLFIVLFSCSDTVDPIVFFDDGQVVNRIQTITGFNNQDYDVSYVSTNATNANIVSGILDEPFSVSNTLHVDKYHFVSLSNVSNAINEHNANRSSTRRFLDQIPDYAHRTTFKIVRGKATVVHGIIRVRCATGGANMFKYFYVFDGERRGKVHSGECVNVR